MASYKQQLRWNEERSKAPVKTRKPVVTLLALATAVLAAGVCVGLNFTAPSGFEGSGAMLMSLIIGFLAAPVVLILCLIALVREKGYLWMNLISLVIGSAIVIWLFSQK